MAGSCPDRTAARLYDCCDWSRKGMSGRSDGRGGAGAVRSGAV